MKDVEKEAMTLRDSDLAKLELKLNPIPNIDTIMNDTQWLEAYQQLAESLKTTSTLTKVYNFYIGKMFYNKQRNTDRGNVDAICKKLVISRTLFYEKIRFYELCQAYPVLLQCDKLDLRTMCSSNDKIRKYLNNHPQLAMFLKSIPSPILQVKPEEIHFNEIQPKDVDPIDEDEGKSDQSEEECGSEATEKEDFNKYLAPTDDSKQSSTDMAIDG
eukprot:c15038_g1_i2.p1 GENE.c15038_g1_i2~~c15038_g1_i2.p1  ORF type:complete len:215 (+),score=39.91 c15038_g1_i2:295-939(+)